MKTTTRGLCRRHKGHQKKAPSRKHTTRDSFRLKVHPRVRKVLERIGVPERRPFVPDPFQVEAIEKVREHDVLVTAPTGAGKTHIAIEAIRNVFRQGGRSWYASPLKALSNAKLEEFSAIFGPENVGILTGDRKENPNAPIIVGTTEILRNQLYDAMHRGQDLAVDLVVMDEAHYLGDPDRGVVWEEVLIYLPARIRLLLLSATIRNAQQLCDWLLWLRQSPCLWVSATERPVPLYPLFLFPHGDLTPLGGRGGLFRPIRDLDPRQFARRDFPDVAHILEALRQADLLPAIFFLKSRADCERAISLCPPVPRSALKKSADFHRRLQELLDQWPFLKSHKHLSILKKSRVGAHHAGQLPHWKLLMERLMQEGYLEAIFSTSTVAAGVNFPARTVVIPQSDRFNGREFVDLSATDLLQMTGRAGRRGMDEIGFVLVVPGRYQKAELIHDLLRSPPDAIQSQIRVNFSMVLNLLLSHEPEEIRTLFARSLATYQNLSREEHVRDLVQTFQREVSRWEPHMACGSMDLLAEVRPRFMRLHEAQRKAKKQARKQALAWSTQGLLTPGRLFLNRRGTLYMVVEPAGKDAPDVEAVRLQPPLQWHRGAVRTHRVRTRQIRDIGRKIGRLPDRHDKQGWQALVQQCEQEGYRSLFHEDAGVERPEALQSATRTLAETAMLKAQLPCTGCELFGPCHKASKHPFARLVQRYFAHRVEIQSVQEALWRSFQHHFRILREEGYVTEEGHLTADGLWASKLRLDQPLLISEGIRHNIFPAKDPALLAALIAPFVMDRERPGESQLSALIWKYPDLATPYFALMQTLHRLREKLNQEGFETPALPFWTVVAVYHWVKGEPWVMVKGLTGIDEGDLAMVMLRTADHLRQVESLAESHPELADSAREAIDGILREPVLVT
ncbi:DEAD/DEAH box helicase [Desulfacinum hydrothermale]|uniref:DEAD/DEAH box helicase n=1 Tax=Desulfacinum hydrothermale TaxID=109258 RepID=UPI0014827507|nr:DEAD/DEAH box helicase [Desulfacinum hydrothermale]